ncbi:MAG TPA: transcriptional regulator [Isosphaeraceae bacterium]|jgi:DNA-binding transcriptional ArsR family regulator|nr:transcriptional regulator [Isosphaeraceae bacterium]
MASKKKEFTTETGRFAYDGLDRIMHEKARLGIMTSLITHPNGLLFGELKQLCSLTDGNLSRHIEVLHEAGLVDVRKGFERKRPQTLCSLTPLGRNRFQDYLGELERVIHDALPQQAESAEKSKDLTLGWGPA